MFNYKFPGKQGSGYSCSDDSGALAPGHPAGLPATGRRTPATPAPDHTK